MWLSKISIDNFRGIKHLDLTFEDNITVLVGENNSGKTSILHAVRYGLDLIKSPSASYFTELDFHIDLPDISYKNCNPISITYIFEESEYNPWPDYITEILNDVIVGDVNSCIKLQITAQYNHETENIEHSWHFLDDSNSEIPGKEFFIRDLHKIRPFFFQSALRAAKDQFHGQSTFWSSFLNSKDIDSQKRIPLEEELFTVYKKIIEEHKSFKDVLDEMKRMSGLIPTKSDNPASIDPAPCDIYKSLRQTVLNLLTPEHAKIPIRNHGEGTQSISVLLLFSAYLKTRLKKDYSKNTEPIIAIEEPESHLHPSAIRSVWNLINDLPGQKIIATHSGDIISEIPVTSIRKITRTCGQTLSNEIPNSTFSDEQVRKFSHQIKRNRGELIFAKTWLLVEGETETTVFYECAEYLGKGLHQNGIRIVEYSQTDLDFLIQIAEHLSIKWFLITDGDEAGSKYMTIASKHINSMSKDKFVYQLGYSNMDVMLCCNGAGDPYLKGLHEDNLQKVTATPETELYWEQVYNNLKRKFSKPAAAYEAVLLMKDNKIQIPDTISEILSIVTNL